MKMSAHIIKTKFLIKIYFLIKFNSFLIKLIKINKFQYHNSRLLNISEICHKLKFSTKHSTMKLKYNKNFFEHPLSIHT